jgi:1-aminocyclopropane-1-carboxylate deaminase
MLEYFSPPVQQIRFPSSENSAVSFHLLREDLNHPTVSGNKWWKLKYNLQAAIQENKSVLTFGGAFSNHIHATAHACNLLDIKSYGIIRGEKPAQLSHTLLEAENCGMELRFFSRADYQNKYSGSLIESLQYEFPNSLIVPEGGSNELAIKGCAEWVQRIINCGIAFDEIILPVGTGATLAGLIRGFNGSIKITGIAVLKNGGFLKDSVRTFLKYDPGNWDILTDYHFGGYAKKHQCVDGISDFLIKTQGTPLDFVYTGKMMAAVSDLSQRGYFSAHSRVLMIHTGGLQGNRKVN